LERDQYLEYENLFITATVSTLSPDTYVRLYRNGVRVNAVGYDEYGLHDGKLVVSTDGTFQCSYVPASDDFNCSSGGDLCWNVSLWRSDVCVASYNFSVIDRDVEDYSGLIWTIPNPSGLGSTFAVEWLYNETYWDGNEGMIYFSYDANFDLGEDELIVANIDADGGMLYSYGLNRPIYFIMCVNRSGSPYPVFVHKHYVGQYTLNEIHVTSPVISLVEGDTFVQEFYGYHGFHGSDVYILINEDVYVSLIDKNVFSETYIVSNDGYYIVSLGLYQYDEWIILDQTSFVVSYVSVPIEPDVPVTPVFPDDSGNPPYLSDEDFAGFPIYVWSMITAMCIVLGMCVIPFFLTGIFEPILSIFFGIAGVAICVVLGLIPLWLPFLFALIVVSSFVYKLIRS